MHRNLRITSDTDILICVVDAISNILEGDLKKYIKLICCWESCSSMIDMNCSVYSKTDHRLDCPVANYNSWVEILRVNIQFDDDVEITTQELTAGLL